MSLLDARAQPTSGEVAWSDTRTLVVAATAAVAVVAGVRHGLGIDTVFATAFVAALGAVSIVDLEERRIPNVVVLPASALALAAVAVLHPEELRASLLAGILGALFFFVPAVVRPGTVGMGDVKLALLMGLALGGDALLGFFVMSLLAGVTAAIVLLRRGAAARKHPLPLGPLLAAGAAFALVLGGGSLYA